MIDVHQMARDAAADLKPRDLPCYHRADTFVFDTTQGGTPAHRRQKIAYAVSECATCPMQRRCLDQELARMKAGAVTFGVYGGTTQAERGRMLSVGTRGPIPGPIIHGTRSGYNAEIKRGLETCGPCRIAHNAYKAKYRRSA